MNVASCITLGFGYTFPMDASLSTEEQDARILANLARQELQITLKEQQNDRLRSLLEEKKQLAQRLENFLREIEQESARIDRAIAQTTQMTPAR